MGTIPGLAGDGLTSRRFFAQLLTQHRTLLFQIDRSLPDAQHSDQERKHTKSVSGTPHPCPFQIDSHDDSRWCVLFLADAAEALAETDRERGFSPPAPTNFPAPNVAAFGNQPHSRLVPGSLASKLAICLTTPTLGPSLLAETDRDSATASPSPMIPNDSDLDAETSLRHYFLRELARKWRDLRLHRFSDAQAIQISCRIDTPQESNGLAEAILENSTACARTTALAVMLRMSQPDTAADCLRQLFWRQRNRDQRVVATSAVRSQKNEVVKIETRVSDVVLAMTARKLHRDPRDIGFVRLTADPIWIYDITSLGFPSEKLRRAAWAKLEQDLQFVLESR